MAKQENEPTMTEVLARMAAIMEEQAKVSKNADARAEEDVVSAKDARKMGRSLGASGVYENRMPPEISAYNPKGDRDNPRPELRCKMIWVGFNLTKEALSLEEIELINQVKPGVYRVNKADGSNIELEVSGRNDTAGRPELLTFHFPCKAGSDRHNHMPMTAYLKEVLAQQG
jgi:hypothetical protein